jgi:mannose-6-phosphate isomerase-like protein (cupin superfamily)
MLQKVNIAEKFTLFNEHWSPKITAELNGQSVKFAKLLGEFHWHHHEHEDELFLVIKGVLRMELRDQTIDIHEGEFLVVPHGVEHRPVAAEEVHLIMFEPTETLNTGNLVNERTVQQLDRI